MLRTYELGDIIHLWVVMSVGMEPKTTEIMSCAPLCLATLHCLYNGHRFVIILEKEL